MTEYELEFKVKVNVHYHDAQDVLKIYDKAMALIEQEGFDIAIVTPISITKKKGTESD